MEYYFPDRPEDEVRRTEVPAGSLVTVDWRKAFKRALVGYNKDDIAAQYAVLYVVELVAENILAGDPLGYYGWGSTKIAAPVQKVIEINVDAWVLAAMQAKLGGTRNDALSRIVDDMSTTEPIVEADLDGICHIRSAVDPVESLTYRAWQGAALHRLLFGREPPT